jgi:hypothetical protein
MSRIFETTVDATHLDRVYVHLRDSKDCDRDRVYIEQLWCEYQAYADRNFHDQIQREFAARIWEMRLAVEMQQAGLPLRRRAAMVGPDLCVALEPTLWIEAVAPRTTELLLANERAARGNVAPVPEDEIILRYTQSIEDKWQKYLKYRTGQVVAPGDAYVVAVTGAYLHFPTDDVGPPWIAKPLFGICDYQRIIQVGVGVVHEGWGAAPERQKPSGAKIEADLFLSPKRAGISAVLFSPHDVKNRPEVNGRPPLSDLHLIHNPFATTPLKRGTVPCGKEWDVVDSRLQRIDARTGQQGVAADGASRRS